jgi:hypothetical protein
MPAVFGRTWMRLRGVKMQGDMKMPVSDLFVEFLTTTGKPLTPQFGSIIRVSDK